MIAVLIVLIGVAVLCGGIALVKTIEDSAYARGRRDAYERWAEIVETSRQRMLWLDSTKVERSRLPIPKETKTEDLSTGDVVESQRITTEDVKAEAEIDRMLNEALK